MKSQIKARKKEIKEGLKEEFSRIREKLGSLPVLLSYMVGEDPSSEVYRQSIRKKGEALGIKVVFREGSEEGILEANQDPSVHGIIVHCPREDFLRYSSLISPQKDVEGIAPTNLGKLMRGERGPVPATALSVMELLRLLNFPLEGREAVIVGRSLIVGKPLFFLLLRENATVTVAHSRTKPLQKFTSKADLLVVAVGKAHLIKPSMVKEGALVVDVGINVVDGKILGDVDPRVGEKATLTPVPGGVGAFTPYMLFRNFALILREKIEGKTPYSPD